MKSEVRGRRGHLAFSPPERNSTSVSSLSRGSVCGPRGRNLTPACLLNKAQHLWALVVSSGTAASPKRTLPRAGTSSISFLVQDSQNTSLKLLMATRHDSGRAYLRRKTAQKKKESGKREIMMRSFEPLAPAVPKASSPWICQ